MSEGGEAIREEMSEIRNEISRAVPERSEEPIEDEWQGYCAQLGGGKLDELQARLEAEDGLAAHLKWMRRPYFMSRNNYDYWQEYRRELSNSVT